MHPLLRHLLTIALLCCTLLLGCTASEDAAFTERLRRARAALKAKRYHEVLRLLQETHNDAQQLPNTEPDKEYFRMEGLASLKLGDYRRAVDAFEKAQPHSMDLRISIAYLHLLLGDAQRAKAIATALEVHYGQQPAISILLGNISLKEHIYHEAEQHFRTASLLDRSSAKAYIGLANTYLLQRYFSKAEENYLKAVVLSKNDPAAYIALLNYYIATGRYDDGIYTSKIALSLYQNNINLILVQYNIYMNMGRIEEGINVLEKALQTLPHSIDLKIRLIRGYYDTGQLDKAYYLIKNLLSEDHENYYGQILMGEYCLRTNDLEMALFYFNKALFINSNSYIVNYYIGLIHLIKNKTKSAIHFLERSIQQHPGFVESHLLLSIIYIDRQKYDLASEHTKAVLQLDPSNINGHLINGISLYFQDYLFESKYEFDVVNFLEKKNLTPHIFLSLIALEMKDFKQAKDIISRIDHMYIEKLFLQLEVFRVLDKYPIEAMEKFFDAYMKDYPHYLTFILLSRFYKEYNDLGKVEEYLLEAKDSNARIVIPYYELAKLAVRQGHHAAAITYLQQAIERQPSFVKAYIALGTLYEQAKDYQKAKITYETGLRYMPDNSVLLNNLAWINLVHFGDRAAAYVDIRKALSLSPEDPDIQDTLAWWYYLNDDHQHARVLLRNVIAARPLNPLYHYHLGMVYLKLGEQQAARHHLRKSMELGIDDESRRVIADLLQ
ncbi:MAG TPA: tetratricopeptide repeat protein [Alphaproteobacteria bacterium]|nr:tetratricopeptide repeat protein [Alphaproteobacteria bacterium]